MLDNKIFFTFIAMILAIFSISKSKLAPNVIENFLNYPRQIITEQVITNSAGQATSEGLLAQSSVQCPAQCSHKPRSVASTASVPNDNMARENYTRENYGQALKSISAAQVKAQATSSANSFSSMVPKQDMTTVDVQGNAQTVHVFDNYIYANAKSRLRGQSDQIRGDLPIVPCKKGNFDVSPNLSVDLNAGALAAMGGVNTSSTAFQTAQLMYNASGGTNTNLGGVNMSTQLSAASNAFAGVNVSAFP